MVCPRDPGEHRTSEDERNGVDPITETKRRSYLGSMKPFSVSVSDWIPRVGACNKIPKTHISQLVWPFFMVILLMEKILHHLGCMKPCKSWDKLPINWCRISCINSSFANFLGFEKKLALRESHEVRQSKESMNISHFEPKFWRANTRRDEIWSDRSPSGFCFLDGIFGPQAKWWDQIIVMQIFINITTNNKMPCKFSPLVFPQEKEHGGPKVTSFLHGEISLHLFRGETIPVKPIYFCLAILWRYFLGKT